MHRGMGAHSADGSKQDGSGAQPLDELDLTQEQHQEFDDINLCMLKPSTRPAPLAPDLDAAILNSFSEEAREQYLTERQALVQMHEEMVVHHNKSLVQAREALLRLCINDKPFISSPVDRGTGGASSSSSAVSTPPLK